MPLLPRSATATFSLRRVASALVLVAAAIAVMAIWGRAIWHPLYVKLIGGTSIAERVRQIEERKPYLHGLVVRTMAVLCFKREKRVEVYCDGRWYRSFPILAASGRPGPKLQEGDRQVPEGIYAFDALNPDSSYHLSARISYPNDDDRRRSAAAGVMDPGGGIYMHGKSASIGCIAIGDDAIEEVFWLAATVGLANTVVIIAPSDLRVAPAAVDGADGALHARLAGQLSRYRPTLP